ncbi:saccharopine dehydrogenase family protein [Aureibacter tunicatorum]|uniref:Saccharopine dehydrogenase (NADP+, L-glutamate forming) n=1 Tax=Aureibacter tunicatorum TaxID=866807 RepID=A0AAE3XNA2_9BACT|nr:saccharopine dehydrogenase C-terminal domain-containing protein [Aureibacter tunicatorum]MDR6239024.1 saccharopine dehydrogenase (NADP+, L-glutamate forming) [Aureibacter tunicatorum]BDD05050.1 saccharopine dehydrogenase [Aureibacter tunicatorum]
MKNILIIGAGRSSSSLIKELLSTSIEHDWKVTVADINLQLAQEKTQDYSTATAAQVDISNEDELSKLISNHDLVISMIPARFHILIAKICIELQKNMLSASYVSPDIETLNDSAIKAGIIILKECGLDPGIDHMSAMKIIDDLKAKGCKLTGFESFTGGLLADNYDENPWEYKFTWNPRNVVIAGNGVCKFLQEGKFKYIPYHKLFSRTELIHIPDHGYFEGYANRDSLAYLDVYNLRGIKTMFRGTLRRKGFSKAWNVFVQLGATDDSFEMENVEEMTHRDFINSFLYYNPNDSVELKLAHYLNLEIESDEMFKLKWLGIFDEERIGLDKGTPAQILEHILKKKWTLKSDEKDMIAMWHKFDYIENGIAKQIQSHMVINGDDQVNTGMSKTVGLPLAIAAKEILLGNINLTGVHRPIQKSIYDRILPELENHGIKFIEREIEL